MKFTVLTLFPVDDSKRLFLQRVSRAMEKGILELDTINIRDFAKNRYLSVDDYPFGGGAGMVMMADPVCEAAEKALHGREKGSVPVIYLTPQGEPFTQQKAKELSAYEELILLCGHYEGVDERAISEVVTAEISIGDYVLSGGELGALVVMDAVSRLVPGVLGNEESPVDESFSGMWLEYPQYTRPRSFRGQEVPEILLSGNHQAIDNWRLEQAILKTMKVRPDLIDPERMNKKEKAIYQKLLSLQSPESLL